MSRTIHQARVGLTLVFAAALLVLGGSSFVRRLGSAEPRTGIEWAQSSAGPLAVNVEPGSPGARAGLVRGDLLLEANGRPVSSALEASALAWESGRDRPLRLEIRRASGDEHALSLDVAWQVPHEPYGYLAIVGLAFWVSGLLVALRWPDVRGGRTYTLLAACLYGRLVLSPTGRADHLDWMFYWLDVIAGALVPALLLHVSIAVTRRTLPFRRAVLGLAYTASILLILSVVWLSPAAAGGAYLFHDPRWVLELAEPLEFLFLGLSLALTALLLVKSYSRSSSAMHRSQTRWLLWGLGVGLGPFVLVYAIPWGLGAPDLPAWARFLAVAPMLLVPAAFTAALARYRLYDLDVLLLRGLTEVGALFSTCAVLAGVVFVLREGLSGLVPLSDSATRYIGFLAAAVAYPQLRSWVRIGVEKAFYRKRYSYRATLLEWARELNAETDLPALLGHLRDRVRETLGVAEAEVLVRSGPWSFDSLDPGRTGTSVALDEAAVERLERESFLVVEEGSLPSLPWARSLFPMRVKGRLRALLAVAERGSGAEPLTSEDRALLGTLAAHAGTAIEAARLVQEVRQRAEEIERLHARQERILESSAVGLLLLDEGGSVLAWNRALEDIYGLARGEAVGKRLGELFPLHVARRIEREPHEPAGSEQSRIFRLPLANRRGQRVVVNIAISPAGDGGRVVTFDDITDRVEMEGQLLQQERLASLGLLAAGVAHEINTPLTGISSYTQLLLEEAEREDPAQETSAPETSRKEVLQKIETQARRASDIANSLLNLARPERASYQWVDVNEAITEVLQLFEPQIRGRGVRLATRLLPGLPPIRGHRGKLQQVLLNLLLNARDAVAAAGEVSVATRRDGGSVHIEVTDDGVGISDYDLPRIFDPFFTTKGRGQGTGLGLSITYGIVQEHGGRIQVDSTPGEKTRFRVELPIQGAAQATA